MIFLKTLKLTNCDLTLELPTSWEEVTLKQQMKLEESNSNPAYSGMTSLLVIAAYTNIDIEEAKKLHITDISNIFKELTFISEPPVPAPIAEFEHHGLKFQIMDTLLKAQFQDFLSIDNLMKDNKGKEHRALPYIIAILAKQKGETLTDFDLKERAKLFEDLPFTVANNIHLFFCLIGAQSQTISPRTLSEINQTILKYQKSIADLKNKRGGSVSWLYRCVREILQSYAQYLVNGWSSYYTGLKLNHSRQK